MPNARLFSTARGFAITVTLSAMLLTSCSALTSIRYRVTGAERTAPDEGQNKFGARRVPVLNPGGALYNPKADPEELAARADNPYMVEGVAPQEMPRQVPVGNQPAATYEQNMPAPAPVPSVAVPAPAPVAPGGPQSRLMPDQPPAMPRAPEIAARPMTPAPVTVSSSAPKPLIEAAAPPAPVREKEIVVASTPGSPAFTSYPALSSTPPNPARPDATAQKQQAKQLQDERELAEAARREMAASPELADMKKDAAASSPLRASAMDAAPIRPVAEKAAIPAQKPMPVITVSHEPPPVPAPVAVAALAPASKAPSTPWQPMAKAEPAPAPAPVVKAADTAAPSESDTRFSKWLNGVFSKDGAPAAKTAQGLEPIHLTPPPPVASEGEPLPLVKEAADSNMEPIALNESAMQPPPQVGHFLADNRYRRHGDESPMGRHGEQE